MLTKGLRGRVKLAAAAGALLLGLILSSSVAVAAPILGQQIYYEGGNVQVTVLLYSAAYTRVTTQPAGAYLCSFCGRDNPTTVTKCASDPYSGS